MVVHFHHHTDIVIDIYILVRIVYITSTFEKGLIKPPYPKYRTCYKQIKEILLIYRSC